MTNADEAINSVLAPDRTTAQRVALLRELREELHCEKGILALLAAAQKEKTVELRRVFFEFAIASDITRITDRETFINGVLHFAAFEEEASMRRTALANVGTWSAQNPAIEDVLIESLVCELDAAIQRDCINGLRECVRLKPENLKKLLAFLPQSPPDLRGALIALLVRFDADAVQDGLVQLLDPAERENVRSRVLKELAEIPRLEPSTLQALQTYVLNEPNAELQTRAIAILRDAKQIDAELFQTIFNLFARFPSRTDLLEALKNRLASFPDLIPKLTVLFHSVRSAQTRVRILKMLERVEVIPLFVDALKDPNWTVRRAAIQCCAKHHANNAAEIERAIVEATKVESIVSLRESMAAIFAERNQRAAEIDREILAWIERETEPRVERALARALAAIPASSDGGGAMLRAYRKVLSDPAFDEFDRNAEANGGVSCRDAIIQKLRNFAFHDSPELANCVRDLLWRADDIEDVEYLYTRLRELEPDARLHADLILALFFRFVGEYPREPLHKWLSDFQALAPSDPVIRAQIPYIVRLTGATWMSSSADIAEQKAMVLPGLMEQIRRGNWIEASRLLREAWESRTLRKSDMILFFKKLLRTPREESLMQASLVMMAKGGITTPDILDLGFAYLDGNPRNGSYTYMISGFLQGENQDHAPMRSIDEVRVDLSIARRQDPHYRQRVFDAFNQRGLNRYFRLLPEEMTAPPPISDWNRWEYELWPDKGIEWAIAKMFFALKPFDRIAALLATAPDPAQPRARSIHYTILLWLWQNPNDGLPANVLDELLRGIGALFRNTAEKRGFTLLHDRATLLFKFYWTRQINSQTGGRAVSPDLAELAADVYLDLCAIGSRFDTNATDRFPAKFPELLQGLSSQRLKACWRFDSDSWARLFKENFEGADEENAARAVFDRAQLAEAEARFADAFACYKELLDSMAATKFVTKLGGTLKYNMDDCDPNKAAGTDDEGAVKGQHDFLLGQIAMSKFEQALRTLDRLMKRYWRTAYFKERRDELVALRREIVSKILPKV